MYYAKECSVIVIPMFKKNRMYNEFRKVANSVNKETQYVCLAPVVGTARRVLNGEGGITRNHEK